MAAACLRAIRQDGVSQLVGIGCKAALVAHREMAHAELARLSEQTRPCAAHREAHHLQLVRLRRTTSSVCVPMEPVEPRPLCAVWP